MGDEIPRTSLTTKAMLASSASSDERSDPSPSLFNDAKLGNSHSISGNDGTRGFDIAVRIDAIAALSRSVGDVGIFAAAFAKTKSTDEVDRL